MSKWTEIKIVFYMFVEFAICTTVLFVDVVYFLFVGKCRK
ncbi:hypothetical protein DTPHA_1403737 [Enterococcus faecium]|jgi:hypothetical protein|nr:hypothetical protein DTPHA_1403737 [Enterococcus faecium]DAI98880.1 MAG TPA: hypothetical protein [Caudoviricetes sp.]